MSVYHYDKIPESLIAEPCAPDTSIIICIPAFKEDNVISSAKSILACDPIQSSCEIIYLVNDSLRSDKSIKSVNQSSYRELINLSKKIKKPRVKLYPIYITGIRPRKFGVGRARKWLMDEAYQRLQSSKYPVKIISSFDADSACDRNYLRELLRYFSGPDAPDAASIYFEHPINNDSAGKPTIPIILYELHLRYYINMQRQTGLPFAFQTLGSAMAVKAEAYRKMGGMNTRQAGEDFYFLHKYIRINQCGEINATRIIPSARVSDRVPFGTGKAVQDILNSGNSLNTYNPKSFASLRNLIDLLPVLHRAKSAKRIADIIATFCDPIQSYLLINQAVEKIQEIQHHTAGYTTFRNRFYHWFDAFRLMKYLHYARDAAFPDIPVEDACMELFRIMERDISRSDALSFLMYLRKLDRDSKYGAVPGG